MIARLIRILRHAGLELTSVEVAEMLLLAAYMPAPALQAEDQSAKGSSESGSEVQPDQISPSTSQSTDNSEQGKSVSDQDAKGGLFPDEEEEELLAGDKGVRVISFRTPKAPALPGAQRITRALRPLRRSYPSNRHFVLDEEKTVQQIADGGPQSPVLKPEPERWLDAALVFDESLTMRLWRPTLMAVEKLFERSGIFRNVRSWILNTEKEFPILHLASGFGQSPAPRRLESAPEIRSPRELLDGSGRRLIVVVSDCLALSWHSGEAYRLLAEWGVKTPVALAQILPQRFWRGTTMTPVDAMLHAYLPGTNNRRLGLQPLWYRDVVKAGGIALPVISLEEWAVAPWAKMVAGSSGVRTLGLIIPPIPEKKSQLNFAGRNLGQLDAVLSDGNDSDVESDKIGNSEQTRNAIQKSPQERLTEFFANTPTPPARQLAHYLASVPLTLPIMQLVQQAMLPKSRQSHLAEFVLGGLIYPVKSKSPNRQNADEMIFEFHAGVRDELINRITKYETVKVIATVTRYIEQRLREGRKGDEFSARLALPRAEVTGAMRRIDPLSRRFAQLSTQILQRFGGYEHYIEQIQEMIPLPAPTPPTEEAIAPSEPEESASIDALFAQAVALIRENNLEQAETIYHHIIGILPNGRRAWLGLADIAKLGSVSEETSRLLRTALYGQFGEDVRQIAAEAVADAGITEPDFIPVLLLALRDENHFIRRAAVEALGKRGKAAASEVIQALIESLDDPSADVRFTAVGVLGNIGASNAIFRLRRMLEDDDPEVRIAAGEALAKLAETKQDHVKGFRIFLSYAREDRQRVSEIYNRLRDEGFDLWMDVYDLVPGSLWEREIETAIKGADSVLICLSRASVNKRAYIQKEIKIALGTLNELPDKQIYLIPVRLEECPIPEMLSRIQQVDLFEEDGWQQLIRTLRGAVPKGSTPDNDLDSPVAKLEKELDLLVRQRKAALDERNVSTDARTRRKLNQKIRELEERINKTEIDLRRLLRSSRPKAKIRIYDLAKELQLDNRRIIEAAKQLGINVRTASNSLPTEIADRIRERFTGQREAVQTTGYEYACYFCFDTEDDSIRDFIQSFHQALSLELARLKPNHKPIFFDQHRLDNSEAFIRQIARALHQSASYIVFCTLSLFSHPFHQRELEAIRQLTERRQRSNSALNSGFYIPVVLQDTQLMPNFLYRAPELDFSAEVGSGEKWFRTKEAAKRIKSIAILVEESCRIAERTPEAFADWQKVALPLMQASGADEDVPEEQLDISNISSADLDEIRRHADQDLNNGEYKAAINKFELILTICRSNQDRMGEMRALSDLGECFYLIRDFSQANGHYIEAIRIARRLNEQADLGAILHNLGLLYAATDLPKEALQAYNESLNIFRRLGDKMGVSAVLGNLGLLLMNQGMVKESFKYFEEQLALAQDVGYKQREGIALLNLGIAHIRLNELKVTIDYLQQAINVFESLGDNGNLGDALYYLSQALKEDGQLEQAISFGEKALAVSEQLKMTRAMELKDLLSTWRYELTDLSSDGSEEKASPKNREIRRVRGTQINDAMVMYACLKLPDDPARGKATIKFIAEKTMLTPDQVNFSIKKLLKLGYIIKHPEIKHCYLVNAKNNIHRQGTAWIVQQLIKQKQSIILERFIDQVAMKCPQKFPMHQNREEVLARIQSLLDNRYIAFDNNRKEAIKLYPKAIEQRLYIELVVRQVPLDKLADYQFKNSTVG